MTKEDYDYLIELIEENNKILKENNKFLYHNNKMLKGVIRAINLYISNSDNENLHDFGRNILANLASNFAEGNVGKAFNFIRN